MKHFLLFFFLLADAVNLNAQKPAGRSASTFRKTVISLRDSTGMYVGDDDSEGLFYYALPPKGTVRGMLVLLPPNGELAEETAHINSLLAALARDSGLLTIVLSINHNLYLDSVTLGAINAMLSDAITTYRVPRTKVVLGGFSLGGMNATRYTELAYEDSTATVIRPAAVYGIDPPLDWARLYHSFTRAVSKNFSEAAVNEANYFLERLNLEFGGPPEAAPATYTQRSMYSPSSPGGGNAKYLRAIPVRIYSDPDIEWHLKNRQVDYYDMNAMDGAAMINSLHAAGNARAEFVVALGKGYRPNGMRHPHSWSLAEPGDCLRWMMGCLR